MKFLKIPSIPGAPPETKWREMAEKENPLELVVTPEGLRLQGNSSLIEHQVALNHLAQAMGEAWKELEAMRKKTKLMDLPF